jgi:hypothetical protein
LPTAQIDGRNPVEEAGIEQPSRRIEERGNPEELAADHSI